MYVNIKKNGEIIKGHIRKWEGELMEVDVPNDKEKRFQPLEKITCEYDGLEFESDIIWTHQHKLFLNVPLFEDKFKKRKEPRINVQLGAIIVPYKQTKEHVDAKKVEVINLSLKGMAVKSEEKIPLFHMYDVHFEVQGHSLKVSVFLKYMYPKNESNTVRYGGEIREISEEDKEILSSYIWEEQIQYIKNEKRK